MAHAATMRRREYCSCTPSSARGLQPIWLKWATAPAADGLAGRLVRASPLRPLRAGRASEGNGSMAVAKHGPARPHHAPIRHPSHALQLQMQSPSPIAPCLAHHAVAARPAPPPPSPSPATLTWSSPTVRVPVRAAAVLSAPEDFLAVLLADTTLSLLCHKPYNHAQGPFATSVDECHRPACHSLLCRPQVPACRTSPWLWLWLLRV